MKLNFEFFNSKNNNILFNLNGKTRVFLINLNTKIVLNIVFLVTNDMHT